jgi:hypothetical protein
MPAYQPCKLQAMPRHLCLARPEDACRSCTMMTVLAWTDCSDAGARRSTLRAAVRHCLRVF